MGVQVSRVVAQGREGSQRAAAAREPAPPWRPAAVLFALLAGCGARVVRVPFASSMPAYHDNARLVVVGDLQRTFFTLLNEQNDPERGRIVEGIALTQDGIEAEVRGLPKGGTTMYSMHRFRMAWPATAP